MGRFHTRQSSMAALSAHVETGSTRLSVLVEAVVWPCASTPLRLPRSAQTTHHRHACCVQNALQNALVACCGEKVLPPAESQGQLGWKPGRTFEFKGKTEAELQEGVTLTVREGQTAHVTLEQVKGFSLQQSIDIWREYLLRWGPWALWQPALNINSFWLQRGIHVGHDYCMRVLGQQAINLKGTPSQGTSVTEHGMLRCSPSTCVQDGRAAAGA